MGPLAYQRNITPYIQALLKQYPVVALVGARQVGKTSIAKALGTEWFYTDLEKTSDLERLMRDPEFFFKQHPRHVIFDEAQRLPELFTTLRGVIDEQRDERGRFIMTGSSSPELLGHISESLAGRIAIIELGTLKANEYFHLPISPFYQLFQSPLSPESVEIFAPRLSHDQLQSFWFKGGYPEPIANDVTFYQEWMVDYENTYVNRDVAKLFPNLNSIAFRRFVTMLGRLSGKIINKSDLARSVGVSQPTISGYLEIVAGTFLWRQLPSFERNANKSVVKMPKGHIRDSGLLHHLLHLNNLETLQSDIIAGFSFEAFVIEEILKGLQDSRIRNVQASYYRTRGGAEIDLILDGSFGILPIEIKYGYKVSRHQLRALTAFIEQHDLPMGLLINQSDRMEWLSDRILQVPAGCL